MGIHIVAFSWTSQWTTIWGYLSEIFWGNPMRGFGYGPLWGGFMNPISGALFFLGALELWRHRKLPAVKWFGVVFLLCLVPGIASQGVEMMRVVSVLPFLLVAVAIGLNLVLLKVPKPWKGVLVGFLFFSSGGLDFYHLAVPYAKAWKPQGDIFKSVKSAESYHAYQILRDWEKNRGTGYLFLDFLSVPSDQTLTLATYPFNALLNPALKDQKPSWAAFLTNVNYRPFLERRFPGANWFTLGTDLMPLDGEWMLGIVPLEAKDREWLERWVGAQPFFHGVAVGLYRQTEGKPRQELLEGISKSYSIVQGDPFLESCYWEINYFNHSADKDFQTAWSDLGMILSRGYPAAHVYNELGGLLYFRKNLRGAEGAFLKAIQLGGEHTLAAENLRLLKRNLN